MKNAFIREKLLSRKNGFSPKIKGINICQNKAVELLHKYGAIDYKSFLINLEKLPPAERVKLEGLIRSSISPFKRGITPIPDPDPEDELEFNIKWIEDRGYLYVEVHGTNHDTLARRLLERIIEISYDVKVVCVKKDDEVWYKDKRYTNLAKIVKENDVIGLIHWVKEDELGREQIIAKFEKKKIIVKYDVRSSVVRMWIYCPPEVKRKARDFLNPFEVKFTDLSEFTPKQRFRFPKHSLM